MCACCSPEMSGAPRRGWACSRGRRSDRRRSGRRSSSRSTTSRSSRCLPRSSPTRGRRPRGGDRLGVAGVVARHIARLTNVPGSLTLRRSRTASGFVPLAAQRPRAMAHAVPVLEPDELAVLQEGAAAPDGNAAVIAGWHGARRGAAPQHRRPVRAITTEGGHTDFAPRTPRRSSSFRISCRSTDARIRAGDLRPGHRQPDPVHARQPAVP